MDYILQKISGVVFSVLLTIIAYFIKMEIGEMASTLKRIQVDVQNINKEALLFKQETQFRVDLLEKRVDKIESRITPFP